MNVGPRALILTWASGGLHVFTQPPMGYGTLVPERFSEPPPQILVVAAEASADTHAAEVVRALQAGSSTDRHFHFFGVAGPALRALGVEAVARTESLSVMGIVDVLVALPRILKIVRGLLAEVDRRRPRVALLIDSPDLNLRLARRLQRRGVKVLYYIGPTLWAWRSGRAKTIRRFVDRMLVIFPFEQAVYARLGVEATYVGNPLLDARARDEAVAWPRAQLREALDLPVDEGAWVVALLPGSRRAEIRRCFPILLQAARRLHDRHPAATFAVPVAATLEPSFLQALVEAHAPGLPLTLHEVPARQVLRAAEAAAVVSGTATLEAVLENTPHLVLYRFSAIGWQLARLLVRVPHWSLTNLIADEALVDEYFQDSATPEAVADALEQILPGFPARERVLVGLKKVARRLGAPGAAPRVAEVLLAMIDGQE